MECSYCERACSIPERMTGFCKNYRNDQGTITENYPDSYLNIYPVNSESIPMLHFWPNSTFLLVSTIGCNFTCEGCISEFQTIREGTLETVLTRYTPEEILAIARAGNCRGISFCLNEPAVSFPTFLRVAKAAKSAGLLVGCSSNGYMTEHTLAALIPYLDYVNIGLKGSSDERYRECGAASAGPVYRNLKTLHDAGVAVEVSTMYINGREREIIGAAERVHAISPDIPFQVMRFIATHEDIEPLSPTREQGEEMCRTLRQNLRHVYLFNTLATPELDSRCPACGETIVHRVFFGPMAARVLSVKPGGVCTCGYRFPCQGEIEPMPQGGIPVLGGYRSIMGVRFIGGIARVLGVDDEKEIDRLSNTVIANGYLMGLNKHTGTIAGYQDMIRYVGSLCERKAAAQRIAEYIGTAVEDVISRAPGTNRPRVLACMVHPLLPMYANKVVNLLVEIAGGRSLNRELDLQESTDAEYTVGKFNQLDPDIILVAGHSDNPVPEFTKICRELGISAQALATGRVHAVNATCASEPLQLVLGLEEIAHTLHPEIFRFSPDDEKARYERLTNRPAGCGTGCGCSSASGEVSPAVPPAGFPGK